MSDWVTNPRCLLFFSFLLSSWWCVCHFRSIQQFSFLFFHLLSTKKISIGASFALFSPVWSFLWYPRGFSPYPWEFHLPGHPSPDQSGLAWWKMRWEFYVISTYMHIQTRRGSPATVLYVCAVLQCRRRCPGWKGRKEGSNDRSIFRPWPYFPARLSRHSPDRQRQAHGSLPHFHIFTLSPFPVSKERPTTTVHAVWLYTRVCTWPHIYIRYVACNWCRASIVDSMCVEWL